MGHDNDSLIARAILGSAVWSIGGATARRRDWVSGRCVRIWRRVTMLGMSRLASSCYYLAGLIFDLVINGIDERAACESNALAAVVFMQVCEQEKTG